MILAGWSAHVCSCNIRVIYYFAVCAGWCSSCDPMIHIRQQILIPKWIALSGCLLRHLLFICMCGCLCGLEHNGAQVFLKVYEESAAVFLFQWMPLILMKIDGWIELQILFSSIFIRVSGCSFIGYYHLMSATTRVIALTPRLSTLSQH